MSVQLELGKYYLTRDGRAVGPIEVNPYFPVGSIYPYQGRLGNATENWGSDGSWTGSRVSDIDLVQEFPPAGVAAASASMASGIQVQAGKFYMTRGRGVVGPIEDNPAYPSGSSYAFRGTVGGMSETWMTSGRCKISGTDGMDLLREVPAPAALASGGATHPKSTAPTPAGLVVQAGRYYRTRGSAVVGPIVPNGINTTHPWTVITGVLMGNSWAGDGFWFSSSQADTRDLITEVPGPATAPGALVVESGKYYKSRDGKTVGPICQNPADPSYPWTCKTGNLSRQTWNVNGFWSSRLIPDARDLVSETAGVSTLVAGSISVGSITPSTITNTPFQVGAGGWYRRRDGVVVGPLLRNPSSTTHPVMLDPLGAPRVYYTLDGAVDRAKSSPLDLVEAVEKPETPLADKPVVPIDQVGIRQYQRGVAATWGSFSLLP